MNPYLNDGRFTQIKIKYRTRYMSQSTFDRLNPKTTDTNTLITCVNLQLFQHFQHKNIVVRRKKLKINIRF